MKIRQRGIILLCTLVIMVILSLLLMVGVYRMQSSAMVTKRAIWNIKSYWAAMAGNTIVADGCIRSAEWPDVGFLTDFHNYKVSNNGNFIEGGDSESDVSVSIYYKNQITGSVSSNPPNEDKLIKYFTDADVSDNEFYALTVGKSGIDISALELVYELAYNPNPSDTPVDQNKMSANQAAVAAACIYVSGSILANLNGGRFSASSSTSTRPIIVAGGNVSISSNGVPAQDPYGRGPLDMKEGTIYATGASLNGASLKPSYKSNNLINYSVNVFPTFNASVKSPGYNSGSSIPSGTFCFIEVPTKENYDAAELSSTVSSVLDLYLTPKQFADLYKNDIKTLIESNPTMIDKIKNGNIELFSSGGFGENSFNALYNLKFKNSLDLFSGTVSGMPSDIAEQQRFKIEGEDGENLSGSDIKAIFQTLHKNYCKHAINAVVDDYSKSISGNATYDSFFVPNGNANISGPLSKSYPQLSFSDFTRARILGNLDEYVNGSSGGTNIKDYDMNVFGALGIPITHKKVEEKDKLTTNFGHYLNSASGDTYIADKVQVNGGDMYCLDTISQHKGNFAGQFDGVKGSIGFDKDKLQIKISSNLKSNGYFNFGAFNRHKAGGGGMPSDVAAILGDYARANKDHVGVSLLGGSALGASSDIDIEGFVYGTGSLQAQGGDVVFDAVNSSILNNEGSVSVIASNDIVIKKSSGGSGNGDINVTGILWAGHNLNVDVGGDTSDFKVRGSIVCKGGNMNLTNIGAFSITYDPSYSRIIVNTSLPTWKQKIGNSGNSENEEWEQDRQALIDAIKSNSQYLVNTGTFKVFNRI